ncbi:MAG TPA: hydrogen gas-evolving membrane-bound hydrogenase subunit E, partial [Frankiaceae bacterium]|nr:hydrogen gas-evolving membrane-bound hydrogenase subunit E [Frankiaceae bacterium]
MARSRLAAVSLLGITGFVLVGWFLLLGAPDLALTQLLVETLTVVVAVLVIRRLPDELPGRRGGRTPGPARRTRWPGWRSVLGAPLAVGVGLGAAAGTYLLTGRRGPSLPGEYYLSEAERETGGRNVVNTILVDFRALDTLGEITVLGVVALGLAVLLGGRRGRSPARDARTALPGGGSAVPRRVRTGPRPRATFPPPPGGETSGPAAPDGVGDVVVRAADRLLGPPLVVLSAYLLLRGHDAPGGGFVGGLVAGGAVTVRWLARGPAAFRTPLLRAEALVGTGVAVAVAYGLGGLVAGPAFLAGGSVGLPL